MHEIELNRELSQQNHWPLVNNVLLFFGLKLRPQTVYQSGCVSASRVTDIADLQLRMFRITNVQR